MFYKIGRKLSGIPYGMPEYARQRKIKSGMWQIFRNLLSLSPELIKMNRYERITRKN